MKKKNLTRLFLNSLPIDTKLPFGIAKNVRITKVFNGDVFNRDSEKINKNCFITFSQFDEKDPEKIVAESTFGYWDISRADYAYSNFIHQMIQVGQILKYAVPKDKSDEISKEFGNYVDTECTHIMDIFDKGPVDSDLPTIMDGMKLVAKKLEDLLSPYYKTGELVQVMIACEKTGKYLELPGREAKGFISHDDSELLKVPNKYTSWYNNRDIPKTDTPDVIGETDAIIDSGDLIEEEEEEIAMDI